MTVHPKAALLAELAEVAKTNERQWEEFEYCGNTGWFTCRNLHDVLCSDLPVHRKPRTIKINGYDVPEPLREAPTRGTVVWLTNLHFGRSTQQIWDGMENHLAWLQLGLIHLTQEAAQAHIDALLAFTRRDEE